MVNAATLSPKSRGWLRHLWRKATTPDDWSRTGEPHPWWDRYSFPPMLSYPRFDLSESSYALLIMARKTPAWREVYVRILDEMIRRHTTWWAAVDWLTQIGPDPKRASYPKAYKGLIPKHLWGQYDVPGWTANGVDPWGLQPDPIGSPGNLFFRGWFNLLLAIYRDVAGADTWDKPFEVTGLEDRTFSWTHGQINRFLSDQWAGVWHGPHCENTKVWPLCLSAAGLGLQLSDRTLGSEGHWVVDRWIEDFLKKTCMGFDPRGNLKWVGLYYDPQLDYVHGRNAVAGLFPAFYLLPQNRGFAETLYRKAVASVGWDKAWLPAITPKGAPRAATLGYLMAREFGDHTTERRLGRALDRMSNGRFFNAGEDGEDEEFGYFFSFGEAYPRGQESALLIKAMTRAFWVLVALAWAIGSPAMAANPLFADEAPLRITLTGPFRALTNDAKYSLRPYPATLTVTDGSGAAQTFPIQVRARGVTRRKYYCEFPPIYLLFDKAAVKGSLFHGQRRLKLVAYCQTDPDFEQRVRLEYLVYRLYNLITPMSFRVRAAEVTYRDRPADSGFTRFGYLIEDIRSVAGRNGREEMKGPSRVVSMAQLDPRAATRAAMLEYMIGNLDWDFLAASAGETCCHNTRLLAALGAKPATARDVVPVPYDFDLTGFVDSPYALPPVGFPIEKVTERFFRGYCAMNDEIPSVAEEYLARRADMRALIDHEPEISEGVRDKTEQFMDGFFDTLADPARLQSQLIRHCRP